MHRSFVLASALALVLALCAGGALAQPVLCSSDSQCNTAVGERCYQGQCFLETDIAKLGYGAFCSLSSDCNSVLLSCFDGKCTYAVGPGVGAGGAGPLQECTADSQCTQNGATRCFRGQCMQEIEVAHAFYGAFCSVQADCNSVLLGCNDGKCTFEPAQVPGASGNGGLPEILCSTDAQCAQGTRCFRGECQNEGTIANAMYGAFCANTAECFTPLLACNDGKCTFVGPASNGGGSGQCSVSSECNLAANEVCFESRCTADVDVAAKMYGAFCGSSSDCIATRFLQCFDGKCSRL